MISKSSVQLFRDFLELKQAIKNIYCLFFRSNYDLNDYYLICSNRTTINVGSIESRRGWFSGRRGRIIYLNTLNCSNETPHAVFKEQNVALFVLREREKESWKLLETGQFRGEARRTIRQTGGRGRWWLVNRLSKIRISRNVSSASSAFSSSSLPPCSLLLLLCRLNIGESVRLTQIENRTCKRAFTLFSFFFLFSFLLSLFLLFFFTSPRTPRFYFPASVSQRGSIDAMKKPMQWILVYFWTLGE